MNKELSIEFVKNFYYEDLGFCGCGNPASILCTIKDFLNVVDAYSKTSQLFNTFNMINSVPRFTLISSIS